MTAALHLPHLANTVAAVVLMAGTVAIILRVAYKAPLLEPDAFFTHIDGLRADFDAWEEEGS